MKFPPTPSHLLTLSLSLLCVAPIVADLIVDDPSIIQEVLADIEETQKVEGLSIIQDALTDSEEIQKEVFLPTPEPCTEADNPYRINVSHIESKGIGYDQGYTTLEGFFTGKAGNYIPFVDVRGHVFDNGKFASNLGVGTRYVIDPATYMLGGNVYYDYRKTNRFHYNQIGVGLEAFLSRWELRANGYLPVGKKRKAFQDFSGVSFEGFSGHNILMNETVTSKCEFAMRGFNLEVGVHPFNFRRSYDFYIGAGPYYFNADDGKTSWGGKVRLKAEVSRYVYLEVSNSYDSIFHNRFQGTVTLSLPFGVKGCYKKKSNHRMHWRGVQPVERQEIIVTSSCKKTTVTTESVAIDPATGQPIFVVFVNNTNANLSPNGTFENPYPFFSLADSATQSAEGNSSAGNVIYVFAGDGTDTHMNQGDFQMKDSQRLLGSGNAHAFNTTQGLLNVPAQTTMVPHLSSASGASIILLANNNEISGFDMDASNTSEPGGAIQALVPMGGTTPLHNLNINNNSITNGNSGVYLDYMTGDVAISNNTFTHQTSVLSAASIKVNSGFGFVPDNLLIENNFFTMNVSTASPPAAIKLLDVPNLVVSNNTMTNMGTIANPSWGIAVFITNKPATTSIFSGNNFSFFPHTIAADAIGINIQNLTASTGTAFIFDNNTMTSLGRAIDLANFTTATCCVRLNGNSAISCLEDFLLDQVAGTINLEQGWTNNGTIIEPNPVTNVPQCSCGGGDGFDSCP